ncbi:MAG: hypothetical protein Q7T19_06705 [Caulobacter sp.]|nr:hypothetical protein [Caulobacter sp.]HRD27053.1 hypothetical protein [Caulobacter sp.]
MTSVRKISRIIRPA